MLKKTITDKRLHLFYSGSVQGVEFRYNAQRIADSLKLAGWVRNLSDGRVEIALEGSQEDMGLFLKKIREVFEKYIQAVDTEWGESAGEFDGFVIR